MKPCNCKSTLIWMAGKGAPQARMLLARGLVEAEMDGPDQLIHLAEEKRFFFPYLPQHVAALLGKHHDTVFIPEIRRFGRIISTKLLDAHARIENDWAKKLLRDAA